MEEKLREIRKYINVQNEFKSSQLSSNGLNCMISSTCEPKSEEGSSKNMKLNLSWKTIPERQRTILPIPSISVSSLYLALFAIKKIIISIKFKICQIAK